MVGPFENLHENLNEGWEMSKSQRVDLARASFNKRKVFQNRLLSFSAEKYLRGVTLNKVFEDILTYWWNPTGRHVGAANSFDLLHVAKLLIVEQFVEVDDDLIEQPDAFDSLVNVLGVELGEVWDARKQNSRIGSENSC